MKEISGTGDINFACSLMSIGFPLDDENPCSIIAHENGHVYSRYHFLPYSIDGRISMADVNELWSNMTKCPANHPLKYVSDFVLRFERGMTITSMFELAHDLYEIGHVKNNEDAKIHITKFPDNPESYALAFILNRIELYALHKNATKKIYMSKGKSALCVDANLQAHKKKELINRLNG